MCVEKLEMNQENETVEKPPPTTTTDRLLSNLTHLAHNIYDGMEYVGEVVAGMLGLDDSKFQDVIDNMTEEDWRIAIQVLCYHL